MNKEEAYDPKTSVGYLVNRAAKELRKMLSKGLVDAGMDLNVEHFRMLMVLHHFEGVNQQELADTLGLDKTHLTRLLSAMETQGFLVRVEDKKDKRNKRLYLTNEGRSKREELMPVIAETIQGIEAKIDEKELAITKKVMSQIIELGCLFNTENN